MTRKTIVILAALFAFAALPAAARAGEEGMERPAAPMKEGGKKERHPEMVRALRALENAKNALEHAAHDFGGHRAKALEHTKAAIDEVKEGLRYDKR